jgi:phytoene/squalene synthetase
LRDLQQDVNELGRVYFPGFSLEEFDEKVKKELVNDIQSDFDEAFKGIIRLPESSRLAVLTAYRYYLRLLDKIRNTPAKKLIAHRIRVHNADKFRLLINTMIKNKLHIEKI